jgi:hypothetical protein
VTRSPRFTQDAVIGMAILVVVLALWRLHSRPNSFGRLGAWAQTNIFGASTLTLITRAGLGRGQGQPMAPLTAMPGSSNQSNQAELPGTNSLVTLGATAPEIAHRSSNNNVPSPHLVSTNLLRTNGPVTLIAVAPSDLVETPPGVAAAVNVPEAAALAQRLGEVGAGGGDIQISLSWHNYNDLDLHCIDPAGEEIFFGHRRSVRTGGELDIDQNASLPYNLSPVENIYWPFGGAPSGLYHISVVYYAPHSGTDATEFMVRTVVRGQTNYFRSTIGYTGLRERKLVCNLRYDPRNPNPAQRLVFVR